VRMLVFMKRLLPPHWALLGWAVKASRFSDFLS
jgi:hypothetical protein